MKRNHCSRQKFTSKIHYLCQQGKWSGQELVHAFGHVYTFKFGMHWLDEWKLDDPLFDFDTHPHRPGTISALFVESQLIPAIVLYAIIIIPIFRWEHEDTERLRSLPKALQLMSCQSWEWNPDSRAHAPNYWLTLTFLLWLVFGQEWMIWQRVNREGSQERALWGGDAWAKIWLIHGCEAKGKEHARQWAQQGQRPWGRNTSDNPEGYE